MTKFDLGTAEIQPNTPIVAGTYSTIQYTYTAGHPIEYTGYIKIAFRHMDDFGEPQFEDSKAPNFLSIRTTGGCRIVPRWDRKGDIRPTNKVLFLSIRDQFLDRGEKVIVTFGDTTNGSPGWHMPTFGIDRFEFKTSIDPIANFLFKELPESPWLSIVVDKPYRLVCTAPSDIKIDQSFTYSLRVEDRWGNLVEKPREISHPGWESPGIKTIIAKIDTMDLTAESNPINVTNETPQYRKFWGDFHGQSGETIGSKSIEHYFAYGRDVARLDIIAHQGNDFMITDDYWHQINKVSKEFYEPGKFVTFPGYEWSANTPVGGHRNIFFTAEGERIARSSCDLLPGNTSVYEDAITYEELGKKLKKQTKGKFFSFAHVGGNYADLGMHDPEHEVAVEVHSAWGTFEWFLREALNNGYRVGFVANSDGHKGDPGASYPGNSKFGSVGGLTCVLSEKLDRESIYQALKSRRCYATSGCRALLDVKIQFGNGQIAQMGEIVERELNEPKLIVRMIGDSPLEKVEVFNGVDLIHTHKTFTTNESSNRIKVIWNGARVRGQDRMMNWNGSLEMNRNQIIDFETVNFLNPNLPVRMISPQKLVWESFTTGTPKGLILTVKNPYEGKLSIETTHLKAECFLRDLRDEAKSWILGDLDKEMIIYRLPEKLDKDQIEFELPINNLKSGDNPIYIRGTQEDGFRIWSSPIYLIDGKG